MGKWATYQKRGGSNFFGSLQVPGPAPTSWTAITGGAGVITVTRFDPLPSPATSMLFRAIDTTTGLVTVNWNSTLTGLVSARLYKVQAAWFGPSGQLSDASSSVTVAAG